MSSPRISVTQKDVDQVIELFRDSIESNLEEAPGVSLDTQKIVNEFQNLLYQRVDRVPSAEDDSSAQDLKLKIENLQKKALRLKSALHSARNVFVQQVQTQAEAALREQSAPLLVPRAEAPPDSAAEAPEFAERLRLLDETIARLQQQIAEANRTTGEAVTRFSAFSKSTDRFFESY